MLARSLPRPVATPGWAAPRCPARHRRVDRVLVQGAKFQCSHTACLHAWEGLPRDATGELRRTAIRLHVQWRRLCHTMRLHSRLPRLRLQQMPGWLLRNGRLHSLLSLRPNRQHHRDASGQRGDPRTALYTAGRTAAGVRAAGQQWLLAAHAAATQSHAYPHARDEAQHAQPRRLDELPSSARCSPFCNHLQRVRGARAPPPRCHRGERAVHVPRLSFINSFRCATVFQSASYREAVDCCSKAGRTRTRAWASGTCVPLGRG